MSARAQVNYPKMIRVRSRRPCPVCQKPTWCNISADGARVVCMRKTSSHRTRNGGWLHILRDRPLQKAPLQTEDREVSDDTPSPADPDHRHEIYVRLLREHLVLSEEHREGLRRRGLRDGEIERCGYRSVPTSIFAYQVARELNFYGLDGVPGFYRTGGQWLMTTPGPGLLISIRDSRLRISALQIRLDEGAPRYIWFSSNGRSAGTSSGAPLHFQNVPHICQSGEAIITEGALKANIISARLDCGVIAIPGVNSFSEGLGLELKREIPELCKVSIAFDQDWREKRQVKAALFRLMRELSTARLLVTIRTWPRRFKGLDDYLAAEVGE